MKSILILEATAGIAWAINTAIIAGLQDVKNPIQIVVCTSIPTTGNLGEPSIKIPEMLELVTLIGEANLVLLSRDIWHYSLTDLFPFLAEKQVTCISSERINGYCIFPDKHNLLEDPQHPRYKKTAEELCTLIKRALNLQS